MTATDDAAPIPDPPELPRLRAWPVVRDAMSIYRREFATVIVLAVVVLGGAAVIDTFVDLQAERTQKNALAYAVILAATGISTIGSTFYAGMLDKLVGSAAHGHPRQPVRVVLRQVPYLSLIVADVLLTAAELVGTVAFIVPGLIITTFLGISGPVITIEGLGPVAGLRRSAQLVRHHFWLVFLLSTIPVAIEHELVALVQSLVSEHSYVLIFFERGVFGALVISVVGIVEVELAYTLIARYRASHRGSAALIGEASMPVVDDGGAAGEVLDGGVLPARDDPQEEHRPDGGAEQRPPEGASGA